MKKILKVLLIFFLASLSLGQLQRIQLTTQVAIYFHDLLIGGWLTLILVRRSWRNQLFAWWGQLNVSEMILMGWVIASLVVNQLWSGFNLVPWLYLARLAADTSFIVSLYQRHPFSLKNMHWLWLAAGGMTLLLGFIQYFLLPDTRFLKILGWDDHYYRLIGSALDPGFMSMILIIIFFSWQSMAVNEYLKNLASGALIIGILLTYSRAGYLSLLVGLVAALWWYYRHHLKACFLVGLTALFFLGLPFLPQPGGEGVDLTRTASINSRISNTSRSLTSPRLAPILIGRGLFTSADVTDTTSGIHVTDTAHFVDNFEVFIFEGSGIIGLILVLIVIGQRLVPLYQHHPYAAIIIISVLIHSQFNHTLFQPLVWLWMWGMAQAIYKRKLTVISCSLRLPA